MKTGKCLVPALAMQVAAMVLTWIPGNATLSIDARTYTARTRVAEGHPSHSAIPAQTQPISESLDLLRMFLWFVFMSAQRIDKSIRRPHSAHPFAHKSE